MAQLVGQGPAKCKVTSSILRQGTPCSGLRSQARARVRAGGTWPMFLSLLLSLLSPLWKYINKIFFFLKIYFPEFKLTSSTHIPLIFLTVNKRTFHIWLHQILNFQTFELSYLNRIEYIYNLFILAHSNPREFKDRTTGQSGTGKSVTTWQHTVTWGPGTLLLPLLRLFPVGVQYEIMEKENTTCPECSMSQCTVILKIPTPEVLHRGSSSTPRNIPARPHSWSCTATRGTPGCPCEQTPYTTGLGPLSRASARRSCICRRANGELLPGHTSSSAHGSKNRTISQVADIRIESHTCPIC